MFMLCLELGNIDTFSKGGKKDKSRMFDNFWWTSDS